MRIFNIGIIILNTLIFFTLGLVFLGSSLSDAWGAFLFKGWHAYDFILASGPSVRIAFGVGGVFLMLLAASTIVGNLQNRRYERTVVFHNPHGEVMIALGALEDLGKVVKAEIAGLKDIKLRVVARRKGLQVTGRVALWSDANLPRTTELIQESVRHYLQEIVGQEQEIRPRVVVGKVSFRDPEEYGNTDGEMRPRRP